MSRERVTTTLGELASEWGLPGLALDENDFLCIETDDRLINIDYFEDADAVSMYGTVAEVPEDRRLECFRMMLQANHGLAGGEVPQALALDPTEQLALLRAEIPVYELTLPGLLSAISNFVRDLNSWTERFEQFALQQSV